LNQVSGRAWSELLHAEVAYLLRRAGIPVLHIKGPTVALWLYDEGERVWGDVDVLVPPSRMDEALEVLLRADFGERNPGVNRHTTADHAITLVHQPPGDPGSWGAEVDVHDRFEGIDADPEWAFEQLWRRREADQLAHVDVWFPDLPTRALLIALNTARDANSKAREDLARLIATGDPDGWADVMWLARRVEALPALRAGLEVDPRGPEVVAAIGLGDVPISPEWELRRSRAPRTALRLEELGRLPWRRRPGAVARWIVPPPAIIRMRDPAARGNRLRLAGGYARRLRDGVRAVPRSVRALRRVRHNPSESGPRAGESSP
jgi:hypothetical protein